MNTPIKIPSRSEGILFVISAPSGAGKSTLLNGIRHFGDFEYSVSCTTRSPRPGERNGTDYHFLSRAEFEAEIQAGNFLEWAEVHGNYYGTRRSEVVGRLVMGIDVLVDVDVQGARSIRACADLSVVSSLTDIFLAPPSMEDLERRLRKRGTETEEQVSIRLRNASREMSCWSEYEYIILSGSPEEDQCNFRAIMTAERMKVRRSRVPRQG